MPKNNKSNKGITRRDFLKTAAASAAGGAMLDWAVIGPNPALAAQVVKSVRNICPYCSIGCAIKIDIDAQDNIIDIYGDSNSVINRGSLCSKGAALLQLANSSQRMGIPGQTNHYMYGSGSVMTGGPMKRTGDGSWTSVSWSQAISEIAGHLKTVKTASPSKSNSVSFFGSSHMVNEECYAYKKLISLFGTNNSEHQARI